MNKHHLERQQINFCNALQEQKTNHLSGSVVLTVGAGVAVLLFSVYFFTYFSVWQASAHLTKLGHLTEQAAAEHLALSKKIPQLVQNTPEANEIEKLTREVAGKSQLVVLLTQHAEEAGKSARLKGQSPGTGLPLGNKKGFSAYLAALSEQVLPGVWLTQIHLDAGGQAITLRGKTENRNAVPSFIRNLKKESIFAGRMFAAFQMKKHATHPLQNRFVLTTQKGALLGDEKATQ